MTPPADVRGETADERAYYSLSTRVYAVFAHFYDAVVFPFRRLRREVASSTALRPETRLLDVATGTGEQALAFAPRVREVVGIDLSEAMLRVARRKNRFGSVTFQHADATELPFQDGSFDASCVSFALHEMPGSIRERVLREMARVTRPGGAVIVVDYGLPRNRIASAFAFQIVKLYERSQYVAFVRSDLDALLEAAGIEPLEHRPALGGVARIVTGRRSNVITRPTPGRIDPDRLPASTRFTSAEFVATR